MLHLGDAAAAHMRAKTRESPTMMDAVRAPAGPRALAHCVGSSRCDPRRIAGCGGCAPYSPGVSPWASSTIFSRRSTR